MTISVIDFYSVKTGIHTNHKDQLFFPISVTIIWLNFNKTSTGAIYKTVSEFQLKTFFKN